MSFRNHFDMISLNEPVTHKAKFWQSYVFETYCSTFLKTENLFILLHLFQVCASTERLVRPSVKCVLNCKIQSKKFSRKFFRLVKYASQNHLKLSFARIWIGTEDMRADDGKLRLRPRALSEFPSDFGRSAFDDRYADPNSRISTPG